MADHDIHVVPYGEQWAVLREGDDQVVSLHRERREAETAGRQLAADGRVAYELHDRDGIGDRYGDDPRLSGR